MRRTVLLKKRFIFQCIKSLFWFSVGTALGLFLVVSFITILFQKMYAYVVYPGVMVNNVDFGGKSQADVKKYFINKNARISQAVFTFEHEETVATASALELNLGYDDELLSEQTYSIGRSDDILANMSLIFQAYLTGVNLSPAYRYSDEKLEQILSPIQQKVNIEPIEALFTFSNGRVSAFRPSSEGKQIDKDSVKKTLRKKSEAVLYAQTPQQTTIHIPTKILYPKVTTDAVNSFGIKEIIAEGRSEYAGSIPNRIHNVNLAASRFNGVLIAPNEVFSFNKILGDVSEFTGYKQAYVIQNGRTVLGDGGGVCQVSTTLFRAALNAGLPIVERTAHAYRVHYYEEDSPPGLDATVFFPTVDLRFKNDTGYHILIQTNVDENNLRLTFTLYGTKDSREVVISKPIITSQTPAPEPSYQDDPSLPKGTVKQVDFAASGARVQFSRKVTRDGNILISEKFVSSYRPWQAIFLRGTQE